MEQGQIPPQQQQPPAPPPPPAPQQGWPSWQAHPGQQSPYGYAPAPAPQYGWGQPEWPQAAWQQRRALKAPPEEHPKDLPWELSGWWSRVGAQLLDLLFVWLPAGILLLGPLLAAESARDGSSTETTWLIITIVFTFLAIGAHLFYAPLLMKRKGRRNGQTLGKQICGIRVIRADGIQMRFSDAALRQIIYKSFGGLVASTFVPLFPWMLDYLWPTWDEQHRALHDLAADTRVVAA